LLRAWASHSYLERTDGLDDSPPPPTDSKRIGDSGNADRKRTKGEFRGLLLSNQTHRFSSELEARLLKKAPSVCMFLIFMGYCVMENRNGLVVASQVSQATGRAERDAAVNMARSLLTRRPSLPARATTSESSSPACASVGLRPMSCRTSVGVVDQRLMAALLWHPGYAQSINAGKWIEQVFASIKQAPDLRQLKSRCKSKVGAMFLLHVGTYNLIPITNLHSTVEVMTLKRSSGSQRLP